MMMLDNCKVIRDNDDKPDHNRHRPDRSDIEEARYLSAHTSCASWSETRCFGQTIQFALFVELLCVFPPQKQTKHCDSNTHIFVIAHVPKLTPMCSLKPSLSECEGIQQIIKFTCCCNQMIARIQQGFEKTSRVIILGPVRRLLTCTYENLG